MESSGDADADTDDDTDADADADVDMFIGAVRYSLEDSHCSI